MESAIRSIVLELFRPLAKEMPPDHKPQKNKRNNSEGPNNSAAVNEHGAHARKSRAGRVSEAHQSSTVARRRWVAKTQPTHKDLPEKAGLATTYVMPSQPQSPAVNDGPVNDRQV